MSAASDEENSCTENVIKERYWAIPTFLDNKFQKPGADCVFTECTGGAGGLQQRVGQVQEDRMITQAWHLNSKKKTERLCSEDDLLGTLACEEAGTHSAEVPSPYSHWRPLKLTCCGLTGEPRKQKLDGSDMSRHQGRSWGWTSRTGESRCLLLEYLE